MSREDRTVSWSVEVRGDGDETRVYELDALQVYRVKVALVCAAVLGLFALVMFLIAVPRSLAYGRVVEENLAIKSRLHEIDRTMSEVDRVLLRLRLYDAQLQSVGTPDGDHGPLPAPVLSGRPPENPRLTHSRTKCARGLGTGPGARCPWTP